MVHSLSAQAILGDGNANLHSKQKLKTSHYLASKSVPILRVNNNSLQTPRAEVSQSADDILKAENRSRTKKDSPKRLSEERLTEAHPEKSADSVLLLPSKKSKEQAITEPKRNKVIDSVSSEKVFPEGSTNKTKETDFDTNGQFRTMYTAEGEDDPPEKRKRQPRRFLDILIVRCSWVAP
jgi:hypothetical protein